MKITSYVSFLYCLCVMLASPTVQASEVRTAIFEGKPCINPPHVVGNYPATPFLFYIPTSGERPIKWHAENLPEGLKLDKKTGIIKGEVAEKGTYKVVLKAENALGSDTRELLIKIGDELLLTPPMGWNSWNTFGRHLTEELVLQTADAMVENGMRDLGYAYINIDDFWQLPERGADGHIQVDKTKFPRGIRYVADYLHERGFKLGIYSDAADKTCGGVCGSYGYEETDARDFASWGVDLLKYDYCNAPAGRVEAMERYEKMASSSSFESLKSNVISNIANSLYMTFVAIALISSDPINASTFACSSSGTLYTRIAAVRKRRSLWSSGKWISHFLAI